MFPFVKKKEPVSATATATTTIRGGRGDVETTTPTTGSTTMKMAAAGKPVSQEEIKHLEETKHRLLGAFGGGGKKREKSPAPQQQQQQQSMKNGGGRPTPPAKPPRLTNTPSEDCDNFHPLKTFNIPGLNLPILKATPDQRTLVLNRLPNGDFPFALRRALTIDRASDGSVAQRSITLIDFTSNKKNPSITNGGDSTQSTTLLQHGDQLLAINDERVDQLSREDIVGVIRKVRGDEVRLQVKPLNSDAERIVVFKRQPNGEFGFLLRRSQVVDVYDDGREQRRTIVLAEPLQQQPSKDLFHHHGGDVPRDQLVAVNGRSIETFSRDELVAFIGRAGTEQIQLTVKPAPTLVPVASSTHSTSNGGGGNGTTAVGANNGSAEDFGSGRDEVDFTVCQGSPGLVGGGGEKRPSDSTPIGLLDEESQERVWLVHRDGYAAGVLVNGRGGGGGGGGGGASQDANNGKLKLRLVDVPGEMVIDVDAVDVEKANPIKLDRVEDLAHLLFLNESSVIHLLRQRHAASLIHTNAGSFCTLVTKPQVPLAIYSEKVLQVLKACRRSDMPPHIFAVAQQTYRAMIANRRSQSIVFTGRSGSGKSTQIKHLVNYLCLCAGTVNKLLTPEKAAAIFNVLESFGNCSTAANSNSSRYVTFFTLDFDHVGEISAGLLQCLILESTRLVRRPAASINKNESNFHVFSYLWRGADVESKKELSLNSLDDVSGILNEADANGDSDHYRNGWARLLTSLETVGINVEERRAIFAVLAAIFHLSAAGGTKGMPSFKSTFLKPMHAQTAAQLLGVSLEELQKTIFISTVQQQDQESTTNQHQSATNPSKRGSTASEGGSGGGGIASRFGMARNLRRVTPFRTGGLLTEKLSITDRPGDGMEALEAFIVGLYRELFNLVVSLINRSLSSNYRTVTSITAIDFPGYQSGDRDRKAAGFGEFCYNYVNERVHAFYHDTVFQNQVDTYRQEKIQVDFQTPSMTPAVLVELIDKPMQHHLVKSTNLEARSQEKRGLLWLLDEESIFPGATDESFIERIFVHYAEANFSKYLTKSRSQHNHFVLRHAFGTFPVTYNAAGWLRLAQENPVTRQALPLLQESNKSNISTSFLALRSGAIAGGQNIGSTFVDNASLRRTTAVYKTLAAPQAMKRKSYCAMLKLQMDYLIENLRRSGRTYFVHCFDPTPSSAAGGSSKSSSLHSSAVDGGDSDLFTVNVPQLRAQIRALQITDTVRFDKSGYPERMLFSEFRRRFECLSTSSSAHGKTDGQQQQQQGEAESKISLLLDDREAASRLLKETFEVDQSQATLGVNYVFMKSVFLAKLEERRDRQLSSIVTLFQAQCRAYLAKNRLRKRRIQETAIRCIQKNINKYLIVRAWPWWKLYTRVLPLVGVQKTEEDIKAQQEELESLRAQYKKLEKQYGELRLHCDRLEARLEESRSEACDERTTVGQLTETLEEENTMRLRAEKELTELKAAYVAAEKRLQKLELESMEYKKAHLTPVGDGVADESLLADEDHSTTAEVLKEKLKDVRQGVETERKRYETEKKEEAEHQLRMKQKLEKKISELQKDVDETRDQSSSNKRLAEKSRDEAHDLRVHVQQLTSRCGDLEKRQRRFDAELHAAKNETDVERAQKERLQREHHSTSSEVLRLESDLRKTRDELNDLQQRYDRVADDVRVISQVGADGVGGGVGGKDNDQQLRLQKQNLERKCIEQEAELNDLSGELHQLQQKVTRLEMQNEKLRQENAKDTERREEEFDELRAQNQRRLRMLEEQLEDERHHQEIGQRKIKELEIRLREAEEAPVSMKDNEAENASLRRHLKKVKALLKDSQTMLEQYQRNAANRGLLKQLTNQLEDANALKLSAVKSKQNMESELDELRTAVVTAESAKSAAEDRCMQLLKERTGQENRLTDLEQEVQDLLKKYKAQVQQSSVDHITLADQIQRIGDLEKENESLKDQVNELRTQLERKEASSVDKHKIHLAETKIRQLESRLELELAAKTRAEANYAKSKEYLEALKEQLQNVQAAKERETEILKRVQTQHTQQQDAVAAAQRREAEAVQRQKDLEATVERLEEEGAHTINDLKLALRRIDDLQAALRDDIETERFEDDEDGAGEHLDEYSSEDEEAEDDRDAPNLVANGIAEARRSDNRPSRPSSGSSTHISC